MLDVRRLVLLREVQARGSIAAAAQALAYTRSAVSQQLTALEREVGVALLDRSNRQATLTAAGRALVARTESVLAELERAEVELEQSRATVTGELRVGVPVGHGPPLLARAVAAVQQRFPQLAIRLDGVEEGGGRDAVRLGLLDLVIASRYDQVPEPPVPGLVEHRLAVDAIELAVGADHSLAGPEPRPLAAFADERWVLDPSAPLGRLALHACHAAGFEPRIAASLADLQAALALVATGWAVTLVPALVAERPGSPVVRIPPEGMELRRRISAVTRAGAAGRPAVRAMLDELRTRVE